MVDEVVGEYISKFLTNEHPTWTESEDCKAVVIQDVRIVYRFRENQATFQGNLQKAQQCSKFPMQRRNNGGEKGRR